VPPLLAVIPETSILLAKFASQYHSLTEILSSEPHWQLPRSGSLSNIGPQSEHYTCNKVFVPPSPAYLVTRGPNADTRVTILLQPPLLTAAKERV
jgi:hypothetical protein